MRSSISRSSREPLLLLYDNFAALDAQIRVIMQQILGKMWQRKQNSRKLPFHQSDLSDCSITDGYCRPAILETCHRTAAERDACASATICGQERKVPIGWLYRPRSVSGRSDLIEHIGKPLCERSHLVTLVGNEIHLLRSRSDRV
jgi:hypothetical protein